MGLFFLIALSRPLGHAHRRCSQRQAKQHRQDKVLSGFHISSPVLGVDLNRAPVCTPARRLESIVYSAGRSLNQENTATKVSRTTIGNV
jgi:hypothetical protein